MAEEQRSDSPPWNWAALTEEERIAELDDLAEWAAELQQGYGRWVRLPACWPCHQALLEELKVFWYWRLRLDQNPESTPEDAVRWHHNLRAAADAWAWAFAGCQHQSLGELDERRDERGEHLAATLPYLERAADEEAGE